MTDTHAADTPFTGQVVHETIDGETVVIDLATGAYFSLEGSAAVAWEGLAAGESAAVTAARIAAGELADEPAVLAAVLGLHRDLFDAGLLREAPADAKPPARPFTMPAVRRYDDMREHLLVDPIHEVERGEGWPAPLRH